MTNHIKICSTCIPYLFDFWANPFVHLLLLKSSMDNVQSVLRCAIVSNVLSLYVGQCTDDDNFWFILTSIRWSRISNTKISSHFGKILFPANAITLSGRLDILSNFWLFKMWPFKQIALHKNRYLRILIWPICQLQTFWEFGVVAVWPEKNRQMSIKVAQKWFQ